MSAGRGVIGQFLLNPTGADPAVVVSISPFTGTVAVSGTVTGGGDPQVRSEPLFEPAVIGLDRVVCVPPGHCDEWVGVPVARRRSLRLNGGI